MGHFICPRAFRR